MSKERLDDIKETYEMSKYDVNFFLGMGDIDWLIEQAERVQELEKREKRLRRHIFEARNDVVSQSERVDYLEKEYEVRRVCYLEEHINRLEKQNKRYREALQYYADRENYEEEMIGSTLISGSKVMYEEGQIAREALEGEE